MSNNILVIIATGDIVKARTGVMYAVNSYKNEWVDDVKLVFFGPAESLLLDDEEIQKYLGEFQFLEQNVIACKAVSDDIGISEDLEKLDVIVDYVGKPISDYIGAGYTPMVW